jgi:hypothetical protein
MPISIVTLGRERSVATLAKRAYRLDEKASPQLLERAQAALLAANPSLSAAGGFKAGKHVLVPEISGLSHGEETSAAAVGAGAGELATAYRAMFDGFRKDTTAAVADARTRAEQALKDLGSPGIREAMKKNAPHLAGKLADVEAAAKNRLEKIKGLEGVVRTALADAAKDLEELARRVGQEPPR